MSEPLSPLPARPSIEQLRKRAKERLTVMRETDPVAKLADAQFLLAREHGFDSWPKLVDHLLSVDPRRAEPQITAPVSRVLGARDVDRAVAFWCDVLGFEVSGPADDGVELRSGGARIQVGQRDVAPDLANEGPPGSAIVFFDTNDVEAMQALEAIAFGAVGIGLCRSEHLFFDHIDDFREMILASTLPDREKAMTKLLPHQRLDLDGIFRAMAGRPVTLAVST
jgi:catechol 2,3-dioxygenase-like lactoylglutathione lyase family enzyme